MKTLFITCFVKYGAAYALAAFKNHGYSQKELFSWVQAMRDGGCY